MRTKLMLPITNYVEKTFKSLNYSGSSYIIYNCQMTFKKYYSLFSLPSLKIELFYAYLKIFPGGLK